MDTLSKPDLKPIFETLPGLYLVLDPDFTIKAVSNAYLQATMTKRESILGCGLFEVFPDNPDDGDADGVSNLRASLNYVLKHGKPHKMAVQKYDIRRTDGSFEERYWSPLNTPVFNEQNEITSIIHNVVDVTSNQKTAKKLKNSEKNYQLLVSSIKDYAIFMIDLDGCVVSWNSGAESIKGYAAAEITGKHIDIFYTDEDIKQGMPQSNLQKAMQYGRFETEDWRVKRDGTLFWASVVITALRNEKGELYGYSKITRDITERKKAQDNIEALSLLINQSNDAIYTIDAGFKIQSWNYGAQKLYGYTKEEVLGKVSNTILRTALNQEEINTAVKEIAEKDYWSGEIKRKTKDDRDIYVQSSSTTIRDHNGVITGYTVVSFDITEQKKLREQVNHLADIVEQSSEAIISSGVDMRMISWNKGAEILFGYRKEEAIGKTSTELGILHLTEQEINAVVTELAEKGSYKSELNLFHKDGSSFFGSVSASVVKNEAGEVRSKVFIIKDLSLHKQLQDQLKKSNDELEQKVKARTTEIIKNEKRFSTLIENNNDIISLLDESFKVFYRSPSAYRITGWADEEMMGLDGTKNIHPDDIDKAKGIVKDLMTNPGKPINCLFRNRHKDGHYLWMEGVVINLLHDEYAKAIVFNFRDVSERISAEEKLAANEKLFRALIENNHDVITLMDESFKLKYRSPSAVRVTGWTNEDMLTLDATRNIHPEDKPYAADIVKEVMANPGKKIETKFRMLHKAGHYLWIEGTLTNLLHNEFVKAVVFNYRDVTERISAEEKLRASENQYRTTLDNMLEGIQIHDFNWQYIYVNDALVGYSKYSREELLGCTPMDKYPGIEQTDLFKTLQRCMDERVTKQLETEFIFPDGTKADFELSVQPVPEGLFILSINITERKKAEKALKEEQDKFTKIAATSPGLIFSFRMESDGFVSFPFASSAFEEIFGVQYETVANDVSVIINASYQQDKELLISSIEKSASNMSPWQLQFRYHHPKKGIVWLEGHSIPTADTNGSILWYGVITDVTERKVAEDKINEQNLRLKSLSDNLPGMMFYQLAGDTFENRKFSYVSSGVTALTGKTPEEILSDPAALYSQIAAEDVERMKAAEIQSYSTMSPFNIEIRCRDFKGNTHWLNIISTPRRLNNGETVWDGLHLDITEKKVAEQQREFEANNLAALINNTHDLIWSVDRNFNLITCNEAFNKLVYQITGKRMKKGVYVFLPEFGKQQLERYKSYYQRAFAGEIFTEIVHDESIENFWSEVSFYPMYEDGTVIGTACFSRNITEMKKAEVEIRNANERFELVVAATNDVIWDWDITTNKLWRNKNYYSHFGYDEKTIPGDTSAWHNGIYPDDKKTVLSGIEECIKNNLNFWTDEYRYLKADKTVAYVLDCGYILYTDGGNAYRMVGAMLDITARKQAEQELKKSFDEKQVLAERLSIILNTLPANIALLDGNGYIIDVNDAWRNFADTNELAGSNYCIGDNYIDISKNAFGEEKADGEKVARGIKAVLKNKLKEFVFEYQCDAPEIKRWFRMLVTPLQGADKAGAVVMHIDISEIRRMEQERLKTKMDEQKKITRAMLMGQEKERNHLGEELHDNINQILAGTKLYLSIVGNKNEELKELINYPMELIDTSIDEIRILCHKMVSPLKNIGLEQLIRDIIKKLEETTKIKTEFIYALPKGILSDDLKLNIYRIIQELINNIVKYAGAENVKIIMQANEKVIDITVADDGEGFDMKKKRKGIGILNIINRVGYFNGKIKIESALGKGCKTSINIPF